MMLILRRYITALTILIGFAYPVVAQSDLGKKAQDFRRGHCEGEGREERHAACQRPVYQGGTLL